jgi:glycosyltransferase involved in cell wall biosynthesis
MELSIPLIDALRTKVRKNDGILLHLHGIFNLSTYLLALSFGSKVPIIAQSHDPRYTARERFSRLRNPLRRFALRKIDRFLLSSETETREFSGVCDLHKIRLAPMPVDMNVFRRMDSGIARMKLGWKTDDRYVLYVGRLEERKGLRYLIQASRILASRFPSLHVVAVGSGSLANSLTKNITFVGSVRYAELPTYYNAADVCVLPSLRESWGRVVLESLACETPVIATMTGCVPTLMKDDVGGLLTIPMRDGGALADRISETLLKFEALRGRIQRKTLERYDSDKFVGQLLVSYKELADRYY